MSKVLYSIILRLHRSPCLSSQAVRDNCSLSSYHFAGFKRAGLTVFTFTFLTSTTIKTEKLPGHTTNKSLIFCSVLARIYAILGQVSMWRLETAIWTFQWYVYTVISHSFFFLQVLHLGSWSCLEYLRKLPGDWPATQYTGQSSSA